MRPRRYPTTRTLGIRAAALALPAAILLAACSSSSGNSGSTSASGAVSSASSTSAGASSASSTPAPATSAPAANTTMPMTGTGTKTAAKNAAGHQVITIDTTDALRFSPATIVAHVGTVSVTLHNVGSYPHNISVTALHKTSTSVSGELGAQTTTTTFTFTKPGTYNFICTYHYTAGMRGKFVIKP
jgi:plastocyanin